MTEKQKGCLGTIRSGKWFQRDNLIILALAGVLLFIIALPTKESTTEKESMDLEFDRDQEEVGSPELKSPKEGTDTAAQTGGEWDGTGAGVYDYANYLEEKLEQVLSGVSGVGRVNVMITIKSTEELVVEKDEPVIISDIEETDAQGGKRTTGQSETKETTIYRTQGNDSEPYVVKRILPEVEGILVVAEGAGNVSVHTNIAETVQTLFDVEAHKVKVVKMKVSN